MFYEWFWSKVDKSDGCWAWTGATNGGYGFVYGDIDRTAHRIAYELTRNIPATRYSFTIKQTCGNKLCVNPDHLVARTLEQRFWAMVMKTSGCWEWVGPVNDSGYGIISGNRAHRVSFEIHYGDIPDGLFVCHKCDNRRCVRPDHLFLGTHSENMLDMVMKGRSGKVGEMNPQAKLSDSDVDEIKRRAESGERHRVIAADFGVSRQHVSSIASGVYRRQRHRT